MTRALEDYYDRYFNGKWYLGRYAHAAQAVANGVYRNALEHFRFYGFHQGFAPGPLFDTIAYEHASPHWRRHLPQDPIAHYFHHGEKAGISPHYLFHEGFYRGAYPAARDAIAAGSVTSGFAHFLQSGDQRGWRPHPLFGPRPNAEGAPHRAFFQSVFAPGAPPAGAPSALFDEPWYVASSGFDPSRHRDCHSPVHFYLTRGIELDHATTPHFDRDYYAETYPGARQAVRDGRFGSLFEHFLFVGINQGLNPNAYFDADDYLTRYPDSEREMEALGLLGPFEHYLLLGSARRYRTQPPLFRRNVNEAEARVAQLRRAQVIGHHIRRFSPLRFAPCKAPSLSVVIVVHNQLDLTLQCLSTLAKQDLALEIIVVDNASTDATAHLERWAEGMEIIRSATNLGYPGGCNLGWRAARAPIVLFLNNDIEPGPGALESTLAAFDDPSVSIVGARLVRSHGLLQEAGAIVWADGSCYGYGRDGDPMASRFLGVRDVDYVSGCFLAARRGVLERLQGFDEAYAPGYFEETDLCARAWEAGERCVVDPAILAFHLERGSFSADAPGAPAALMARNRTRFSRQRAAFLKGQLPPQRGLADLAADRRRRGQRREILVIDDLPPRPEWGSGLGRTAAVLRQLQATGTRITIIATASPETLPEDATRWAPGDIEVQLAAELPVTLDDYIRINEQRFALIWVARASNLAHCAISLQRLRSQPDRPRLILDTEAVVSRREWLRRRRQGEELSDDDLERALTAEFQGALAFDAVVAVNHIDRELLGRVPGMPPRHVLGHSAAEGPDVAAPADRSTILFVGAVHDNHDPNVDTLMHLLRDIWPAVRESLPETRLVIAGYWAAHVVPPPALVESPGVEWLGAVANLAPLYEQARLFVAPARYAAGIPIKVLEAAAHGLPVVVSDLLADQLGWLDLRGCASADNPESFAQLVVSWWQDAERWQARAQSAARAAQEATNPDQFHRTFEELIEAAVSSGKPLGGDPVLRAMLAHD